VFFIAHFSIYKIFQYLFLGKLLGREEFFNGLKGAWQKKFENHCSTMIL